MRESISTKVLEKNYLIIKEFLGHIPSIDQMAKNSIYPVSLYLKYYGTWYNFLEKMNDLTFIEKNLPTIILNFFQLLEETKMTKSYKMGLFLILFNKKMSLKQSYSLEEIAINFKELYTNFPFNLDFQGKKFNNLEDWELKNYETLILSNPIHYLTENKNSDFFIFKNDNFILSDSLYFQLKNNTSVLDEIINRIHYRLFYYFKQKFNIFYKY